MNAKVVIASLMLVACAGAAAAASTAGGARATLQKRLGESGRAEVTLRITQSDPLAGGLRTVHATLALEAPDRARLEVPATGEKVTLRSDGGEWLQPRGRQLLRLRAEHGALAMRWWRALLDPHASWRERALADGRVRVTLAAEAGAAADSVRVTLAAEAGAAADSADLWLDARGLPTRLELASGPGGSYRLNGWRFLRARGPAAFKLAPPAGYEVVELP